MNRAASDCPRQWANRLALSHPDRVRSSELRTPASPSKPQLLRPTLQEAKDALWPPRFPAAEIAINSLRPETLSIPLGENNFLRWNKSRLPPRSRIFLKQQFTSQIRARIVADAKAN